MQIEHINLSDLKPYDKNAKKHPQKQIDLLADNINRFGFTTPILVDKGNNVIAGHGRLLALKKLRKDNAPCVRMEHLTDDEVKALRLADNKIAELGEWDMDLAVGELKELGTDLLELTGFDKDLIIEPDEKDDEVPEVPEEPQSKLGDLYELGNHRVLCGDSTKLEDVERLMDGKKADMVFTDPPYNMGYTGSATKRRERIDNDDIGNFDVFMGSTIGCMVSATKASAPFYVFTCEEEVPTVKQAFTENGLRPHQTLIWKKHRIGFGGSDYQHQYEPFVYGWRGHKERYMINQRNLSDVWEFARPHKSELHPTMKPVELIVYAIGNSSKQDDILLDLFLGSGSTLIAAEKTGRICYGMELDPKYIDVIVQRYVDYTGNTNIIKNGEPITWQKSVDQAS